MGDRGIRRGGAGAPFYAPPRRKTSAEIISEARAAIYGDMGGSSSGGEGYSGGNALRPLRTRRPFTPRDPQRTLFTDRERRKEARPPSAFNLKYLSEEAVILANGTRVSSLDMDNVKGVLLTETQTQSNCAPKKVVVRAPPRVSPGACDWSGLTKLPHLNGRSKPLHRRNTTGHPTLNDSKADSLHDLTHAILITQPFGADVDASMSRTNTDYHYHTSVPDTGMKRKLFGNEKAHTFDAKSATEKVRSVDIGIKHLSVQLPSSAKNTIEQFDNMGILELAEALSVKSRDVERTLQLMEALYKVIEENQPSMSLRDFTLRSLYVYIDSEDERLLVAIARIMLMMRVTGAHLAAACKIVFKVARNDNNDHFFRTTNLLELLVEGCGRADPVTEGECCVYGAGALRFLALEPGLRASAHAAGALHLAALHLKILNNAKAENPRMSVEHSSHALYQLTGALRNLAGGGGGGSEPTAFVSSGAIAELLSALQLHHTDRDVLTNVVRCLSVLSADSSCCLWLCASSQSAHALLSALATCASRAALAVRLTYTLGNMAAAEEHARINIYGEDRGVDVLLLILETYAKRKDRDARDPDLDPDLHLIGSDLGGSDGSNEDVLIKTVRVIANLCLARRVGRGLAEKFAGRVVHALLQCLQLARRTATDTTAITDLEEDGDMTGDERRLELATASLATLNNVTFYREPPPPPDPLAPLLERLCRVTCRWLTDKDVAACEAVRALGNLSRCPQTAKFIVLEGALGALAPFLHHELAGVRCAAAGVLVNVCGAGGFTEASRVVTQGLAVAARDKDAATAALLTRALWNAQAHQPLSPAEAARATAALDLFIDDESVFAACEAKLSDRRASNPELSKYQAKIMKENHKHNDGTNFKPFMKSYSVDQELHLECSGDEDPDRCSGEDLGFEEGDLYGECGCECGPCRRLAAWEELVGVAIPLLEQLRPVKSDASVGTDCV